MCTQTDCGGSCHRAASLGATVGVLLGCALAWQVATVIVVPVVRALAVAVVVAVAGLVAAFLVLGVLRLRRRRRVLSRRVLATAGVTAAAIPAIGVPLALAAGAPLLTGPATVAGVLFLARFAWSVIIRPSLVMLRPGAYERALTARNVPVKARVIVVPQIRGRNENRRVLPVRQPLELPPAVRPVNTEGAPRLP